MDKEAWWAAVHVVTERVRHDLVTKQQQQSSEAGKTNKSSRSHESSYLCGVGLDTKGYQGTL